MSITISIIGILLTIFFVIGTHEAAHFYMARAMNVKVLRFSIGFGKTLFRWFDRKGTEYVIALVPLGGYVKMLDENEGDVKEDEKAYAFNRQPFYKRFLIVLAGPMMNLLCALLLYWVIFMIGFTAVKPIIGKVVPNSIAAQAGFKPNEEIISVDGRKTSSWSGIILRLLTHIGNASLVDVGVKANTQPSTVKTLNLTNWEIDGLTPDPLGSLGIRPYEPEIPLIIGVIAKNAPAMSSGLKPQDRLQKIDGKSISNWEDIIRTIEKHPDQTLTFTVIRDGKEVTIPVKIGSKRSFFLKKTGYLGIAPKFSWPKDMLHKVSYGPVGAFKRAAQEMVDFTTFNILLFGKLLTGKLSIQSLGGPITIFESAGDALNSGYLAFLAFLAFLSISIGIINLLPIPGLDGGHLFIYLLEVILRRPISPKILDLAFRLGFIFLILILIQALMNDLLRLS